MERDSKVQLTLWPEDSHAKTSQLPEKEPDSKASGRRCGSKCFEWSASVSQPTSLLRTRRCSVHGDSILSSKDLPTSGLMRRGTLYPQPTAVRRTSESGCGFFVGTPTTNPKPRSAAFAKGRTPNVYEAAHFPTPTAQDANNNGSASQQSRNTPPLNVVAQMLPTPLARCANSPSNNPNRQGGLDLQTTVGGKLNPEWVAWLMGWPIGWASFAPLGMDKFQSWLQQHSEC